MIIAFHSYKGGVGRSLALTNVAATLALRKKRNVGCLDLDVDAPGLHIIFGVKDIEDELSLLSLLEGKHNSLPCKAIKEVELKKTKSSFQSNLYLLPTIHMREIVDSLIWDKEVYDTLKKLINSFFSRYNLDDLLDDLLIDVRTGSSATAPLAYLTADTIVILFRLGKQNLKGTKELKNSLESMGKKVILIPCAAPSSDKAKRVLKRAAEELEMKKFPCVLHYDEDLALEEEITVLKDPKRRISREYRKLTEIILEELK